MEQWIPLLNKRGKGDCGQLLVRLRLERNGILPPASAPLAQEDGSLFVTVLTLDVPRFMAGLPAKGAGSLPTLHALPRTLPPCIALLPQAKAAIEFTLPSMHDGEVTVRRSKQLRGGPGRIQGGDSCRMPLRIESSDGVVDDDSGERLLPAMGVALMVRMPVPCRPQRGAAINLP